MSNPLDPLYRRWLAEVYETARMSPDPSTQVGAGIVLGTVLQKETLSYNGPPFGAEWTDEQWANKEFKYAAVCHAERRAVAQSARNGLWLEGATMVGTWMACGPCAGVIADAGIKRIVRHYPPLDDAVERWLGSITIGDKIFKDAGVEIIDVIGSIEGAPSVLRGGEEFFPAGLPCQEVSVVE